MQTKFVWVMAAVAALTLAGCNKAASPADVQNNVVNASEKAADKDAEALDKQDKADASTNADLAKAEDKADEKKAGTAYEVAVTEAEGAHKIAIEKCNVLSGEAQKACKDQADAKLELAKANAKAEKADHS
jgi:hypothetical protein